MNLRDFTLRHGTQDYHTYRGVVVDDEYGLAKTSLGPDDVVIDVGANIGCFSLACLERGVRLAYAVEPDADAYALLVRNLSRFNGDGVRLVAKHAAVGAAGTREEYYAHAGAVHTAMGNTVVRGPDAVAVAGVDLDTLIRRAMIVSLECGRDSVRLLKLDCEGAEWPALHTCTRLGDVREVVGEGHPHMGDWSARGWDCTRGGMYDLLRSHGFRPEITDMPGHDPKYVFRFRGRR